MPGIVLSSTDCHRFSYLYCEGKYDSCSEAEGDRLQAFKRLNFRRQQMANSPRAAVRRLLCMQSENPHVLLMGGTSLLPRVNFFFSEPHPC